MGRPRYDPQHPTFTAKQQSVIRLIARGLTNKQIGEHLHISPRTAKAYIETLKAKLRVNARREIPAAYLAVTGDSPYPTKEEVKQQ